MQLILIVDEVENRVLGFGAPRDISLGLHSKSQLIIHRDCTQKY